jgi:hypothetical protein
MKALVLSALVGAIVVSGAIAQSPDTLWTHAYGGPGNEIAFALAPTSEGGYIMAGYTQSDTIPNDFLVVKTNADGDVIWSATYGGDQYESAESIQPTSDGGYVIVGSTNSFGAGGYDIYLVKIDALGNILWTRTYGGYGNEYAYSMQQTTDNGYVIAGMTTSYGAGNDDYYLVRIDSQGDTLWTRTYGSPFPEQARCMQRTSDGGFVVAGYTMSAYAWGVYVVKTDSQGDTMWTHLYEPPYPQSDAIGAYTIKQTSDLGYVIAGYALVPCMTSDLLVIRTDSMGDTLWLRIYPNNGDEAAYDICETHDGDFDIVGYNSAEYQDEDVYFVRIDSQGDMVWSRTIGGASDDAGHALIRESGGCRIIAGSTSSFGAGGSDFYLVKFGPDNPPAVPPEQGETVPVTYVLNPPYPNPFNPSTTLTFQVPQAGPVELAVYNIEGRLVRTLIQGPMSAGTHMEYFDGTDDNGNSLGSGIYFCRLSASDFQSVQKMVLLK